MPLTAYEVDSGNSCTAAASPGDCGTHPHSSEAMIHLAMLDLMARRLTGEATLNWRGT